MQADQVVGDRNRVIGSAGFGQPVTAGDASPAFGRGDPMHVRNLRSGPWTSH